MNSSAALFFVLLNNQLTAWSITSTHAPRVIPIHGENTARLNRADAFLTAVTDVLDRLQGEGTAVPVIHCLLDQEGFGFWGHVAKDLQQKMPPNCRFQALSWEWLTARFGIQSQPDAADKNTLTQLIFPWLISADDAAERQQMQAALVREHDSESARLASERVQLQQDNERLRAMNAALQRVDAENLVRFLPALYPRIFTVLGAADLALLCGRVEPLAIDNPYPEPSEETLHVLQKDFRNLPTHLQQQVVDFVKRLPQRQKLNPRAEMREMVYELERH